jgi:hypothetical protein
MMDLVDKGLELLEQQQKERSECTIYCNIIMVDIRLFKETCALVTEVSKTKKIVLSN